MESCLGVDWHAAKNPMPQRMTLRGSQRRASITLSKKSGPPASRILVSGRDFERNVGVDIYFDTKDKVLVVTDGKGEFHDARIWQMQCSPRCRQKVWLFGSCSSKVSVVLGRSARQQIEATI